MHACSEILTLSEMARTIAEVSGMKVDTLHLSAEVFDSEDFKNQCTMAVWHNYNVCYRG